MIRIGLTGVNTIATPFCLLGLLYSSSGTKLKRIVQIGDQMTTSGYIHMPKVLYSMHATFSQGIMGNIFYTEYPPKFRSAEEEGLH